MQENQKVESRASRGLAITIVILVLAVSGALAATMKQASRPAELAQEGAGGRHAHSSVRPGQDAPQLPPPTRKMAEIPVVSEDRVVFNSLVPEAKRCLGAAAPSGYLTVVVEVEQSGHPIRAAATSFTGAPLTTDQSGCLAAALQKLQFARSGTSRLLQRRYFLGGGAPPVEAHLPERVTPAEVSAAVQSLGSLATACPSLAVAARPPQPDGGPRLTFAPEGAAAWQPVIPHPDASSSDCVASFVGRLRLPAVALASAWRFDLRCGAASCELLPSLERAAEAVE